MVKQLHFITSLFIFFISVHFINAQTVQQEIQDKLGNYFSIKKEVAYLHLNKSILLQGEQLGFSAYIVNKLDLTPSISTSNLYVQIRNSSEEILQEELLLVENGAASGVFNIDDTFAPGEYTITAFTNWMRNFEEQNYFTETIRILGTNLDNPVKDIEFSGDIDAQFLPESGHFLDGIMNAVGVIVKDENGHGLANALVVVKDSRDKTVGKLILNHVGIGKFAFIPRVDEKYNAVVTYGNRDFPVAVNIDIEKNGVILSAKHTDAGLRFLVQTNPENLSSLEDRTFILSIKGRKSMVTHSLDFGVQNTIALDLDLNILDPGMNIATLFDEAGRPVAERLFFNYNELPLGGIKEALIKPEQDSLQINVSFNGNANRIVSVSILPQNTVSYNQNHNIQSYNLLQPFVRGPIENASWYFEDITHRKKYELDNLLITQGWSSYDWDHIFQEEIALEHRFEEYFELKARVDKGRLTRNDLRFLVHATSHSPLLFLDVPKKNDEFIFEGFIPIEGEKVSISRVKNNDQLVPAEVHIESFPNHIPDFRVKQGSLNPNLQLTNVNGKIFRAAFVDEFLEDAEDLGEVLITAIRDKEKERERRLGAYSYGKVWVITETDILSFFTLADYLLSKNFILKDKRNDDVSTYEDDDPASTMAIYLDGSYISDHSVFYNYPLYLIDHIELNRTGMGGGLKDAAGFIKIYTDHTGKHMKSKDYNRIQEFEIPLAYARKKTYYTPQYENTSDSFFQQYGVIDWKPNLRSRNGEDVGFQIKRPEVDFKMIIEGIAEDGTLIHEITTFKVAE